MCINHHQSIKINNTDLCFSHTGFAPVSNKPSTAAPASLEAPTRVWNSSPLATFRPRRAFTRPAGWRPPCPPSSRAGTTWSIPRSRRRQVWAPAGPQSEPAPPWTSPQTDHRHGASPRPYRRRPASTPVTTCRNSTHRDTGDVVQDSCRERVS